MDYSLLKSIIDQVEAYQEGHTSQKVEDFTIWLNTQLFESPAANEHAADNSLLIAFKLMVVAKTLKRLAKGAFAETKVSSIDEYSFLLHLNAAPSFRKMELVEMHNLEAPTGIEIIKRLLKNRFIHEFPDDQDKRAKRIAITQQGIDELSALSPRMDRVFSQLSSPLSLNEKVQLSGILDKLIH